jgi:hypothetical protein
MQINFTSWSLVQILIQKKPFLIIDFTRYLRFLDTRGECFLNFYSARKKIEIIVHSVHQEKIKMNL